MNNSFFLSARGSIVDNEIVWLMAQYTDSLVKIDINTKKCIACYPLPGRKNVVTSHASICKNGIFIYIFPFNGTGIYKFNTKTEEFLEIDMRDLVSKDGKRLWGWISFSYKEYVFFVGEGQEGIYRINIKTDYVDKYTDYVNEYKNETRYEGQIFGDSFLLDGDVIYLPGFKSNVVVKFDLDHCKHSFLALEKKDGISLRTINKLGDDILLTTYNGEEIILQENAKYIINKLDWCEGRYKSFYRVYVVNGRICFIPAGNNELYYKTSGEIRRIELSKDETGMNYDTVFQGGNKIFLQIKEDGSLYSFDMDSGEIQKIDIEIDKEMIKKTAFLQIKSKLVDSSIIFEVNKWELGAFISEI